MKKFNFMAYFTKLVKQRNAFLAIAVILAFTVVLQSVLLLGKSHRTVVVPTRGESFWVEDIKASKHYTEQMGAYLSDMLLTRSPADVQERNARVFEHVHPRAYHMIRDVLVKEQDNIIKQQQSHIFRPENSYVRGDGMTYVTEGDSLVLIDATGNNPVISQQDKVRYSLHFKMQGGKILLTGLKKEMV